MRILHASLRMIAALSLITLATSVSVVPVARAATTSSVALDAPISIARDGKVATAANYTAYPLLNVGAVPPLA